MSQPGSGCRSGEVSQEDVWLRNVTPAPAALGQAALASGAGQLRCGTELVLSSVDVSRGWRREKSILCAMALQFYGVVFYAVLITTVNEQRSICDRQHNAFWLFSVTGGEGEMKMGLK